MINLHYNSRYIDNDRETSLFSLTPIDSFRTVDTLPLPVANHSIHGLQMRES